MAKMIELSRFRNGFDSFPTIFLLAGLILFGFGGINYAALNKDNGQRGAFCSRFGENGQTSQY